MTFDAVTERELPSREVLALHLLRHGEVDTGGRRAAYGHTDLPLTPKGRREGAALVDHALQVIPRPDRLFSSDLSRCTAIAERLAAAWGIPLESTPALREQFMGAWENRAWEDLTREDPAAIHAYWADYLHARPTNGESLADCFARAQTWWEERRLRAGRVVVVSHIGPIRALLCGFLGHPADQALRFAPARGSHTQLLLAEAGVVLERMGERPTLSSRPIHRPPRVALSGSAGVGKTTLGRAVAAHYDVPFLEEGMRKRLESGLDLHSLGREGTRALMVELWEEQRAAEDEACARAGGFVADRSSVDFAAFWLFYGFGDDHARTAAFQATTLAHASRYDRILVLPWGVLPLVSDGVRSPNPWLQRHFQATVEGMLTRELPHDQLLFLPAIDGPSARLAWVTDRLG